MKAVKKRAKVCKRCKLPSRLHMPPGGACLPGADEPAKAAKKRAKRKPALREPNPTSEHGPLAFTHAELCAISAALEEGRQLDEMSPAHAAAVVKLDAYFAAFNAYAGPGQSMAESLADRLEGKALREQLKLAQERGRKPGIVSVDLRTRRAPPQSLWILEFGDGSTLEFEEKTGVVRVTRK